jgi:hypothetical protein
VSDQILDGVTFSVVVHRLQNPNDARGGPWLVRVYQGDDHVHSAEGGVPLEVGVAEAQRAMVAWCVANGANEQRREGPSDV